MHAAVLFGATPIEAGCAVVVAAVIMDAYLISGVTGTVGDSFRPKVDELKPTQETFAGAESSCV
jgi:hypothetical protein